MAKMIPDNPKQFDPKSQEGLMFDELNNLPEDYYVFHSFSIVTVKGSSDVIIVIDIDKSTFDSKGEQLMYVGTSRARYGLSCIVNMTEADCPQLMENRDIKYNRNILKSFATAFNAKVLQNK